MPAAVETDTDRERRLQWERDAIAHALTQVEAGLVVDLDEVDAWLDSLGAEDELPMPQPRPQAER